jgi:ABC-type transport system involved in multi-copper enzyme maturation permease subunit
MSTALGHVWRIGKLTFLEAVRQRFFLFLMLISVALIFCAIFFRQFDFGASELKFVADFGMGGIFLFGSILAVVATAQLFFSEIENRTALTILAKPVRRWAFIAGKFVGVSLLLLVFVGLVVSVLAAFLWWRQGQFVRALQQHGDTYPADLRVQFWGLAIYAFLQWLKFSVLAAITILVASFSNTNLFTVVMAFLIQLICQLEYIAADVWKNSNSTWQQTHTWLLNVFPNFQLFNVGDLLVFPISDPLPRAALAAAMGYGVAYVVVILALAVFSFRGREI